MTSNLPASIHASLASSTVSVSEPSHWLHSPLFLITLTLLAYQLGQTFYRRTGKIFFLHPLITSSTAIASTLMALQVDYEHYFSATYLLHFLLGPATVALALPLHRYFHCVKTQATPIVATLVIGSLCAITSTLWLADSLGASQDVLLSLAPKSVTTPIALNIIDVIGGSPFLTAGVVVTTGVVGATVAPLIFQLIKVKSHRIQGFTLGLTAHGVGTAKAFEISGEAGAFASLALGLTGIFIALVLPHVIQWFV